MAISATTIANYAPWGNAQLAFEVAAGQPTIDPTTGNAVQSTETVEYLASLTVVSPPQWQASRGVDPTTYSVQGRLLSPATLDPRITNGSQADATLNGYRGRFELTFDLAMDQAHYRDLRQSIQGTFRVIGGSA